MIEAKKKIISWESAHCQAASKNRGGILPFYAQIQAEHRAFYIDFDAKALFGGIKKLKL
jgi:hypothetical protein